MAKIITFANHKGGVGKSTLSLNLAFSFMRDKENNKVGFYDADPQGSCKISLHKDAAAKLVNDTKKADYYIVDTPPYLTKEHMDILSKTDVVIIPVKAGIFDVLALKQTFSLIGDVQKKNKNLQAFILFNECKHIRNKIEKDITEEIQSCFPNLSENKIKFLKTRIHSRISFSKSVIAEEGIYSTNDLNAKHEISELKNEIKKEIVTVEENKRNPTERKQHKK